MDTILITYKTRDAGAPRTKLVREILKYSSTKLTDHTYVIQTDDSPKEIFRTLSPFVDPQGSLYVMKALECLGWGDGDANRWLATNLDGEVGGTLH